MIHQHRYKFDRVMIIDDNEIDIFLTSRIIEKSHFGKTILKYLVPEKALLYLQDNQENHNALPQVIFVDIHMPIMTGFEFMIEYAKLSPIFKINCQVFIISSTCDHRDIITVKKEKNAVAFREKPITYEFLDSIER